MPDFSFHRGERLGSKKSISKLFKSGKSVVAYPIRIIYLQSEHLAYPAAVVISVPKRLFRRAVDRNLLKRRIREAYRLNKPEFYSKLRSADVSITLVIQYQQKEIKDFSMIQSGLKKGLDKVFSKITE